MANLLGEVYLTKTTDRAKGVADLTGKFDLADYRGKHVALKANFNSADPFPASTHLTRFEPSSTRSKAQAQNQSRWQNAAAWATPETYSNIWAS
jgi:hypothetical protein